MGVVHFIVNIKKIKIIILPGDIVNKSFKLRKYGHLKKLKEKMNLLGKNI